MSSNSGQKHRPYFGPNRRQLGRPRTRPPARRVQVDLREELLTEVDAELLAGAVEVAAGASPYRVVIEMALEMWLNQQRQSRLQSDAQNTRQRRERPDYGSILQQQALASPPTPSDGPKGRSAGKE